MYISTIATILLASATACYGALSPANFTIPQIANNRTLNIINNCSFPIYPAILSTNGTAPYTSGFLLNEKASQEVWVSSDWVGRVWARTNCTWAAANSTTNVTDVIDYDVDDNSLVGGCLTGDCGPSIQCHLSGISPCTLAEFTITGYMAQTYYDISLVDGYNLDMSITPHLNNSAAQKNNTPICVASRWLSSQMDADMTKNSLNESYSFFNIERWCPKPYLLFDYKNGVYTYPKSPASVFPYPDDNDESTRGGWTPCKSACAYTNSAADCCTGQHSTSATCGPNGYSKQAKEVCGDAYSYAYDDATSTFAIPTGPGFDITFCPGGESTNIMKALHGSAAAGLERGVGLTFTMVCLAYMMFIS